MSIDNGTVRATTFFAHTPTTQAPKRERQTWRHELTTTIKRARSDVMLFIYASARLGSVNIPHVGPRGHSERQYSNGMMCHALLSETGLYIPSTFVVADPTQATNSSHCIDYVCIP